MGKGAPRKQNEGSKISTLPPAINEFIFDPPVAPVLWPRKLFHLIVGSSIPLAVLYLPNELIEWKIRRAHV